MRRSSLVVRMSGDFSSISKFRIDAHNLAAELMCVNASSRDALVDTAAGGRRRQAATATTTTTTMMMAAAAATAAATAASAVVRLFRSLAHSLTRAAATRLVCPKRALFFRSSATAAAAASLSFFAPARARRCTAFTQLAPPSAPRQLAAAAAAVFVVVVVHVAIAGRRRKAAAIVRVEFARLPTCSERRCSFSITQLHARCEREYARVACYSQPPESARASNSTTAIVANVDVFCCL